MSARDRVLMTHPALPDHDPISVDPAMVDVRSRRGWVEVKSSTAVSVVESNPPTEGATPSEEDTP